MTLTRPQIFAIVAAALFVAVLGLLLVVALVALRADHLLAQAMLAASHGQMDISNVVTSVTSADSAYQFLSK